LGALGAFIERELLQSWLIVAAFIAVSALVIVSYATTAARGELGITTEISALLAFIVGALCGWDNVAVASAVTVVCLLLLTLKDFLHRLAHHVELVDVEATLQFAVISVIILPLLPNETFGPAPLDVINPYKIWLMVVLIAGLNFLGYVLVKVLGDEHGIVVTGIRVEHRSHLEFFPAQPARTRKVRRVRPGNRDRLDDHVPSGGIYSRPSQSRLSPRPSRHAWLGSLGEFGRIAGSVAAQPITRNWRRDRRCEPLRTQRGYQVWLRNTVRGLADER